MRHSLIILALLISGCAGSGGTMEEKRAEVMKVHDNAMARMGEIRTLVGGLEGRLEGSSDSLQIKALISQLENADEGMMKWMEGYQEPEEGLGAFYSKEMGKVAIVAEDINKSIEDAKKYMDK